MQVYQATLDISEHHILLPLTSILGLWSFRQLNLSWSCKTLQEDLHLLSRCWPKKLLEKVGGFALWEKEVSREGCTLFTLPTCIAWSLSATQSKGEAKRFAPNHHHPQQGFCFGPTSGPHPPFGWREFWLLISYVFFRLRKGPKRLFDPVERDMFGCGLGWYKAGGAHPLWLVGRQRAP